MATTTYRSDIALPLQRGLIEWVETVGSPDGCCLGAGDKIDKGAGIRIFGKIGDHVEKGQPLYRIHAYDRSELDLATSAAKANCGYTIGAEPPMIGGITP